MIFTDRTITVRKGESRIDEPIVVYRGDYELEVRFTILNSRFKFMSGTNMIESEKASYGQLAILTPYGGNIFSDIVRCNDGSVTFVLTAEMLNQIEEVGLYSFQIRLMDYNKESRVSIPPIEFGIEVREPIASEDHDNSVNNAIVGYSIAKVVDPKEENVGDTFDESGNYNKTKWETGDRISEGKLNKIEDAIDKVNQNEISNSASLSKRIDNNFSVLDATKADKNEIFTMANMGQDVKEAMTGGSVAVVGENTILEDNIVNKQVTPPKTSFLIDVSSINMINLDDAIYEGNGLTITIKNNRITVNGETTRDSWLKFTNDQVFSTDVNPSKNEWLKEVASEFKVGETYTAKVYEISGSVVDNTGNDSPPVIISIRDANRESQLSSENKNNAVVNNRIAYGQIYFQYGRKYNNYTIECAIVDGNNIPEKPEGLVQYMLDDCIKLPISVTDEIAKILNECEDNDYKINKLTYEVDGILAALKAKDVSINKRYTTNKLYEDARGSFSIEGLDIDISDGIITINGLSPNFIYIKLTNGYDISVGSSGGNRYPIWALEDASEYITVGESYYTPLYVLGGSAIRDGVSMVDQIVTSGRNADYENVMKNSRNDLAEVTQRVSYMQLYLTPGTEFDNFQVVCGLYENVKPDDMIIKDSLIVDVSLPRSTRADYPSSMVASRKLEIPGVYFNAIQGACVYDHYLYCGVVNQRDDTGNTTLHKIDLDTWKIIESKTEFSVGHCNGMTYCEYDGYIHCVGLESFEDYKRIHRITTDLEYVDSYIVDISPYYPESTGVGCIKYDPYTESFLFQIRGDKKGYARYTKNLTFIDILWTENLSKANSVYGGFDCDRNFIYQGVWDGPNSNRMCVIDYAGNTLVNLDIPGITGEIEGIALYKNKIIVVGNQLSYKNHNVFEVSLSDFVLSEG